MALRTDAILNGSHPFVGVGLRPAHMAEVMNPPKVPHHDWEKYLLILQMFLYALSAYILFTRRANRYYHPPMYVDE